MQDIELLSQMGTVVTQAQAADVATGLAACVAAGLINDAEAQVLGHMHAMLWRIQMAARLLSTGPVQPEDVGSGGMAVLVRATGEADVDAAETRLLLAYDAVRSIIDTALGQAEHIKGDV